MKYSDYVNIYDNLRIPEDIDRLERERGLDRDLLLVIYTQRTVRDTKKKYHRVKRNGWKMVKDWRRGTSLMQLSRDYDFPPVLMGMMVFQEMGWNKKQFWKAVREPETMQNNRIREEIAELVTKDPIYSPWGNDIQHQRGEWGESLLQDWLDSQNIGYRTENDIRGEFPKTPDCLLDEPLEFNGWKLNWIESKASFGDNYEVRWNVKRQLVPYTELFGPGMVVYWFGYLDDIETPDGIEIADISILEMLCNQ